MLPILKTRAPAGEMTDPNQCSAAFQRSETCNTIGLFGRNLISLLTCKQISSENVVTTWAVKV